MLGKSFVLRSAFQGHKTRTTPQEKTGAGPPRSCLIGIKGLMQKESATRLQTRIEGTHAEK